MGQGLLPPRAPGGPGGAAPLNAYAPGRVNLIGDHTDYTGGLVLPMALGMGTTVRFVEDPASRVLELVSDDEPGRASVELPVAGGLDLAGVEPAWARVAVAVAALVPPPTGGAVRVSTTLPIGAGLSSSSALSVALAFAFGVDALPVVEAAQLCRTAEERATGVPVGIMDQLVAIAGRAGNALLIDCAALTWDHVPIPEDAQVLVAHCGRPRLLAGSAYAERRAECEAAAAEIGPLATAVPADVARIGDPVLRRRARHVVSENARVTASADAFRAGDLRSVGSLMTESHRSLAEDFEVSTPALDDLVERLRRLPGVYGARLTGAGFGGCAVAVAERDALDIGSVPAWLVHPTDGAWRRL